MVCDGLEVLLGDEIAEAWHSRRASSVLWRWDDISGGKFDHIRH